MSYTKQQLQDADLIYEIKDEREARIMCEYVRTTGGLPWKYREMLTHKRAKRLREEEQDRLREKQDRLYGVIDCYAS